MSKVRVLVSTLITVAVVAGGTIVASDKPKDKPKNNVEETTPVVQVDEIAAEPTPEQTEGPITTEPSPEKPKPPVVDEVCLSEKDKALKEKKDKLADLDARIAGARDWLIARYGEEYYQTHDIEADIADYIQVRFTDYRKQIQAEHDSIASSYNC